MELSKVSGHKKRAQLTNPSPTTTIMVGALDGEGSSILA